MLESETRHAPARRGRRIVVAFNPTAGSGGRQSQVARLVEHLAKAGLEATICPDADLLAEVVGRLESQGELRGVIAAGGDGTFSLVANRLPPATPLAVYPLGTENLLARYLGHTADPRALVRLFREGQAVSLDAGCAEGRLFTLMAGCGFDAEVVHRLHRSRKGNIRHWSYIKPILDSLRTYAYPKLALRITGRDGASSETTCCWAFVVNVPRYAFGLELDREASPCDGLLNVVTFRDGSLLNALRYLGSVIRGRHLGSDGVECYKATEVEIQSSAEARYQLDGDPGGELPAVIRCLPGRLRVLVSPQWQARHAVATSSPVQEVVH
jgi:diacylglycerol kinase family enzyme